MQAHFTPQFLGQQALSILLLLLTFNVLAQDCPPGDVNLNSQTAIDQFLTDYPNCTQIEGELTIADNNNSITNLNGLQNITKVHSLTVQGNPLLTSLEGIVALTTIENQLSITGNPLLIICQTPGICNYLNNPYIVLHLEQNATGCNNLFELVNNCQFGNCPPPNKTFASQEAIDSILIFYPFCKELTGRIVVKEEQKGAIANLKGFSNITSVNGKLEIRNNENLSSLEGLENLQVVNDLKISRNEDLPNLQGLDNLQIVNDNLYIWDNDQLTNLKGIEHIPQVKNIYIGANDKLESLEGIPASDDLIRVTISHNTALKNLNGLKDLAFKELEIRSNQLESFEGISVNELEMIYITNEHNVENLEGLESIISIGKITLFFNKNLQSLEGLDGIQQIGILAIWNTERLENLTGIETLVELDSLKIIHNDAIQTLEGLNESLIINTGIEIRNNPLLSFCSVEPICNFLATSEGALIEKNILNCANEEAVMDACGMFQTNTEQIPASPKVNLHYDVQQNIINIKGEGIRNVEIFDVQGHKLATTNATTPIHIASFAAGIYFVHIQTKQGTVVKKIMK